MTVSCASIVRSPAAPLAFWWTSIATMLLPTFNAPGGRETETGVVSAAPSTEALAFLVKVTVPVGMFDRATSTPLM